ncbi:MAG: hypothetical protein ABI151_02800, partial [Chitinophagaceae bacterium]
MPAVTMPTLEDTIEIKPEQIESFRKQGHTLVKSVLRPDEVPVYREAINNAAYRFNKEKRALE